MLDLMGNDFARMFKRADADSLFVPGSPTDLASGANGKFFFYSDAPAYYDATAQANATSADPRATAGLIGYRGEQQLVGRQPFPVAIGAARQSVDLGRVGKCREWQRHIAGSGRFPDLPGGLPVPRPHPAARPEQHAGGELANHRRHRPAGITTTGPIRATR